MSLSTVVILIFYTCSQSRVDAAKEGEIFGPPTLNPKVAQRAGHVQLELVADWRVACVEEDIAALLPPYSIAVVVCVERKGIRVPITRGPAGNYLIT